VFSIRLTKLFNFFIISGSHNHQGTGGEVEKGDHDIQIGEGNVKKHNDEDIETIVNLVTQKLQSRPTTSNWTFYERAVPTTVEVQSSQPKAQFSYSTEIKKSDFNDVFDLKKVIAKISKEHRNNAIKLLGEIEQRSTELNFDSKGVVYIDGEAIPGNFFLFFPILFKKRIPKSMNGFSDFLNKLNSMGLQHLFPLQKNYQKKIRIDQSLKKELNQNKSWWLLT